MKQYFATIFLMFLLAACSSNIDSDGDFRTAAERMADERKGSLLGKEALTWEWHKGGSKSLAKQDPMWEGASLVLSRYPISFTNYHARIIQTDWIPRAEGRRYRLTLRTKGTLPKLDNLSITVLEQVNNKGNWENLPVAEPALIKSITNKILMEATRIHDTKKID